MADERPPNLVQLTTEYEVADPSRKGLNSIDDGLWYLITEKITRILFTHINATTFSSNWSWI
ncbi:hypothetical protein EFM55_11565 [Lactiplantibacillus pentosus]|nr:hypothetical protein [Lactiplantibacillus pentosus]